MFTHRGHGDLAGLDPAAGPGGPDLAALRHTAPGLPDAPWVRLRQVHGDRVVTVTRPGEHAGAEADGAVTAVPGVPLVVRTADCAPLLLVAEGAVAVVHAGWRGLLAGVVDRAVQRMHDLGHPPRHAVLGPTIRPRCYEFGADDLAAVAARFGPTVRSATGWGTPALDLPAAVAVAVAEHHVTLTDVGTCTACSPVHWSHRARADVGRQGLVAWVAA